jgi:hypothetical protein
MSSLQVVEVEELLGLTSLMVVEVLVVIGLQFLEKLLEVEHQQSLSYVYLNHLSIRLLLALVALELTVEATLLLQQ